MNLVILIIAQTVIQLPDNEVSVHYQTKNTPIKKTIFTTIYTARYPVLSSHIPQSILLLVINQNAVVFHTCQNLKT